MNTHKTILIVTLCILICGLIGYWLYLEKNRYTIIKSGSPGITYEIDKKTGKSWMLRYDKKIEQIDPEEKEKINLAMTQPLPNEEFKKVTGNALFSDLKTFCGDLYNGSTWIITKLNIRVKCMEWEREFSVITNISPLTTESFSFKVTGYKGNPNYDWLISGLWGHPEKSNIIDFGPPEKQLK